VIGSDGVWEFLSNEAIADLVIPYYFRDDPEGAAEAVV
jgi:serine/threonine protein phosphatase PrpC